MRLFARLYDMTLRWAGHRHAPWYLGGMSFAESSFFPIPPDVMLAPMALARPERAMRFAFITTVMSVLGGLFGYLLGYFAFELIEPLILGAGYGERLTQVQDWFLEWGFWIVLVAGFSPIPYKLFTVAAGAMSLALAPFLIASVVARGARFYLVAGILAWGGPRLEPWLKTYIERIGWGTVVLLGVGVAVASW